MEAAQRIEDVQWEDCCLTPGRNLRLEHQIRRAVGSVPPGVSYFAECPWIAWAIVAISSHQGQLAHVDLDLEEKINLTVSQDNSCRYCFAAHRLFMRMMGTPEERIRHLEHDLLLAGQDERERAALEFARRLSQANPLPGPEAFGPLRAAGFSDAAIKEIIALVSVGCFANRVCTMPALPPRGLERLPDRWRMRVVGPVMARLMRRRFYPGRPVHLDEEQKSGDFGYAVAGLDGLPIAVGVHRMLEGAWSSPHLSRRARALIIAVVARGLRCPTSEREAARILEEEGLPRDQLEIVLRDLASPALNPVEAVIVPFARETIWYRPAPLQRRSRGVRERLTEAQFLDLVGTASLANMLCRLSPALTLA